MLGPDRRQYDWNRFWIHFVSGGLLGAMTGFLFWLTNWTPGMSASVCIGAPALLFSLLGGVFSDRFWERFLRFVGRWGWWM